MEYYAKSVGKCLSKDRVDRIVENTISLINEYDENGYYELICKLKTYLKNSKKHWQHTHKKSWHVQKSFLIYMELILQTKKSI